MAIIKKKQIVDHNVRVDFFSEVFSSVLFIGHIPAASGTFGALFGILFFFLPYFDNWFTVGGAVVICFIAGIITSNKMIPRYGHDPSVVVIDEVVGMWITMLFVLPYFSMVDIPVRILIAGVGFISFRFFDIVKIWPSKYFDKMNTGFGIMMDDVIAALYAGVFTFIAANVLLFLIIWKGLNGKLL